MSNVETWPVTMAQIELLHDACGKPFRMARYADFKPYFYCSHCHNGVRANPEKAWGQLPDGSYGYTEKVWPSQVIISIKGSGV